MPWGDDQNISALNPFMLHLSTRLIKLTTPTMQRHNFETNLGIIIDLDSFAFERVLAL